MNGITRRRLLQVSGALAGGLVVGGCGGDSDGGNEGGSGSGPLLWWDPRQPLADIHREIFTEFAETDGGMQVDYTVYNPAEMGEASPTSDGLNLLTGEYAFHDDQHIAALEWWLAMQKDGVLMPASKTLDMRAARARWAAGSAGMLFDAQFNIGEVVLNFSDFEPMVGLGPAPIPEEGTEVSVNKGPVGAGASLWISADSPYAEPASQLISEFGTKDIQARLAEGMNAPPIFEDSMDDADVHDLFRKAIEMEFEQVFLAPSAVVRKPDVATALAQMKPISPNLGEIVAGAMTGDVTDYKGRTHEAKCRHGAGTREGDRGSETRGRRGVVDDWAFPDWKPRENYGPEKYA